MIHFIRPIFPPLGECRDYFQRIYDNLHFSNNGPFVQELERLLGEYLNVDNNRDIILVNNATSGLLMAIKALELERKEGKKEKEILVSSFTFPATVGAIKWAGAKYRYIDINIDTYNIDETLIEDELRENNNIEAIMPVNCFGNVCNVDKIDRIAKTYGIKVIYDSAPALGSEIPTSTSTSISNKKVGNFGDIEVFSLHATKILPVGEGGFLSVKNKDIGRRLREMKNFGFDKKKNIVSDGLNFKMSEFNAIFGIIGLKYLDSYVLNRRKYVDMYKDRLEKLETDGYIKFQDTNYCKSSYQGLTIRVDEKYRDKLFDYLMKNGIECKKYFDVPLHMTDVYKSYSKDFDITELKNTEKLSSQVLSLPLYSIMDERVIDNVTNKINEVLWK